MAKLSAQTRLELKQGESWREWGRQFGWKLYGWTFDQVADFFLPSGKMVTVTKEMRDGIDQRIETSGTVCRRLANIEVVTSDPQPEDLAIISMETVLMAKRAVGEKT